MNRDRAKELAPIIAAYGEGKMIQIRDKDLWFDLHGNNSIGFDSILPEDIRIKPEFRTRPMTRGEFLYMVTTTPAMVARIGFGTVLPAHGLQYTDSIEKYEYAIINHFGEPIDGWKKFEVEE